MQAKQVKFEGDSETSSRLDQAESAKGIEHLLKQAKIDEEKSTKMFNDLEKTFGMKVQALNKKAAAKGEDG